MPPAATVTLAHHGLELRCAAAEVREDRPVGDADLEQLAAWTARYRDLASAVAPAAGLLALGQELFAWLNGADRFLDRILDVATPPLLVEFAVGRSDNPRARTFLDAPWELLAQDGRHWALGELAYSPVRRIGKAASPPAPSPNRLSVVFMAAAPRGADNLDYEAEEASILGATRSLGLDLVVEESGELEQLAAVVARERPDVVQISCHGALEPEPGLLLEDEVGDPAYTKARDLVRRLAAHHPRLLFLSACQTGQADPELDSLARSLVRSGAPAVLGWAASVRDREAALFAAYLHHRLAAGEDLAHALAYARLDLAGSQELEPDAAGVSNARDWHLARLYLNPMGGGALATASGPRKLVNRGAGVKAFLDRKGKRVPVAGELEFVGRRRSMQAILREFRASRSVRRAGALIRGMGRQGKSSVAARVAHRLEPTHETVVIYDRYDAPAILAAFRERIATPEVMAIIERYADDVRDRPAHLLPALTELLEGPCAQVRKDADGRVASRPVLLVVDDLERALQARETGLHVLAPEYVESIRAVVEAFASADTDSRLLFTSRFLFTLPASGGADLATQLYDLPLPAMDSHEAQKQAFAKLRVELSTPRTVVSEPAPGLWYRAIAAAQGNPGLQDILVSRCLADEEAGALCLDQMDDFLRNGSLPSEQKVRDFFLSLALQSLLDLLAPEERDLLRKTQLFQIPVPRAVVRLLSADGLAEAADRRIERLSSLGLIELYESPSRGQEPELAGNALAQPLSGELTDQERRELAQRVTGALFESWGGEAGNRDRSYAQDNELTRLALCGKNAYVAARTTADALRDLARRFEYRQAAEWAKQSLALLDEAGAPASVDLLRTAAERCEQVGDTVEADGWMSRALEMLADPANQGDAAGHAATLIVHARALVARGRPDEALPFLERAQALLPPGREQAIVLGDIARIRAEKGEVEGALELHQEELKVYEGLGDKRSRAVTLGDIARIRAGKGEVEAALELHQEELKVYEGLGDKRSRAVTLGDIARIRADKGEVEAALELHQERLGIFEGLGDKRERAVTLGDIAQMRGDKGEVEAALELHQERLEIFEGLGDKDGIANTMWSMARIDLRRRQYEAAFPKLVTAYRINLELGRLDGICMVGLDVGQLLCAFGSVQEGVGILARSRDGFVTLGRMEMARWTQALIDQMPGGDPPSEGPESSD
ncbi:MAG: CHAT domain-containing protein [Acidobacteria bacterium]|nr:CHAT domain-containing protein [Acidobacteriota bacterium]